MSEGEKEKQVLFTFFPFPVRAACPDKNLVLMFSQAFCANCRCQEVSM